MTEVTFTLTLTEATLAVGIASALGSLLTFGCFWRRGARLAYELQLQRLLSLNDVAAAEAFAHAIAVAKYDIRYETITTRIDGHDIACGFRVRLIGRWRRWLESRRGGE